MGPLDLGDGRRVPAALIALAGPPTLEAALRAAIAGRRLVFVAGLPASGKSLVVRRAAALAADGGRRPYLLQWDVARLPFDTPGNLARYPEAGGVTHAAIRVAVGEWARGAVRRWHAEHPSERDLLIGETPLAGERLMTLARPREDPIEGLLAGDATLFVIPVPSREVRRAIEDARAADTAGARDAASAAPHLVSAHWSELVRVARALGLTTARDDAPYHPDLYAGTYARVLRHRHTAVVALDRVLPAAPRPVGATEIVPSPDEVTAAMRAVERLAPAEIERRATEWYRT